MVRKIDRDANRFKQIVRGKIKSDLRKYITHGELIGKTGGSSYRSPCPRSRFRNSATEPRIGVASARGPATSARRSAVRATAREAPAPAMPPGSTSSKSS